MMQPPSGVTVEPIELPSNLGLKEEPGPWPLSPRVSTWPEPIPLGPPAPEPLPLEVFPEVLRDQIESVAASVQVDPTLVAGLILAAVSAAVAGKVVVRVDGAWDRECVGLYVVAILPVSL